MLNFGNKEFRNLQEQVLENAKNIEILKERPTLKPVVVAELPAVGEENILYLVPKNPDPDTSDADSYDEYIWLPETQSYEFVGSTALNLSNMVTTDTEQTITGAKTFTSDVTVQGNINVDGETIKSNTDNGEDWSITNKNGTLYYERTGLSYSLAVGGTAVSVINLVPKSPNSYNIGVDTVRWNALYLNSDAGVGKVDFGNNATITKDSSSRLNLNNNGTPIIKVGDASSTYCAANWNPDEDNKYLLGTGTLRWKGINVQSVINANGKLALRGTPDINIILGNKDTDGAITPSGSNKNSLGSTTRLWKAVYTKTIGDDTTSVNVADIATKPNFDSPTVYASGTLDNNGQSTIDMATLGVPTPGLYMFKYYSCQCYVTFTTENISNATTTPILVSIPIISGSAFYAGWLSITRNADVLTLTVASSNGPVSPQGIAWSICKVM